MDRLVRQTEDALRTLFDSLFAQHGTSRFQRVVFACAAVALFLFGALQWARLANYGHITFEAGDWYKEQAYYTVIHRALVDGTVPFHVNLEFYGTDRFLALPEIVLSPQVLILAATGDVGSFVLLHVIVLSTVGFLGCLALQRRFRLSIISFAILAGLLCLNGSITAHIAVGHTMWGGYFFLPWFFLALFSIIDAKRGVLSDGIRLAFVLFMILLQGSLHIFIGCLLYLVLFLLFNPRYFRAIAIAGVGTALLNAYRILPAAISLSEHPLPFQSGYPTIRDLIDALTAIRQPSIDRIGGLSGGLFWWEMDVFIGFIAFTFLIVFGIYSTRNRDGEALGFPQFLAPNLLISVFALGHFYAVVNALPIPFATVERVPSRFLILALVPLIIIACVRLDRFIRERPDNPLLRWIVVFALIQTYFELLTHLRFWNIRSVNAALPPIPPLDIAIVQVPGDAFYTAVVRGSVLISTAALLACAAILLIRAGKREVPLS